MDTTWLNVRSFRYLFGIFSWRDSPLMEPWLSSSFTMKVFSRAHTTIYHNLYDSPVRVFSCSQRPPPDNTRHSKQTVIHAPGGIRTHDLSRRAAADLGLRPRGHWDRQTMYVIQNQKNGTDLLKLVTLCQMRVQGLCSMYLISYATPGDSRRILGGLPFAGCYTIVMTVGNTYRVLQGECATLRGNVP
jgi:hypothetical protein